MGAQKWPPYPHRSARLGKAAARLYIPTSLPSRPEDTPRSRRGEPVAVDHYGAVDDHVRDARWITVRVGIGRLVLDGGRVEDRDVGREALAQQAAIRESQPRGRHPGHLVHRRLQREEAALARVLAEDTGKRAVGPRVR